MKVLVTTVAAMLLAIPAGAQGLPPWMQLPKDQKSDHPKEEPSTAPKADDKAYRSALDGVPQIKNHDPWRSVREPPKSKNPR
jgi:hypothetical protein